MKQQLWYLLAGIAAAAGAVVAHKHFGGGGGDGDGISYYREEIEVWR